MKRIAKLVAVVGVLSIVVFATFPFESTYSSKVTAKAYLYVFGTDSGRTGGYIFFDTAIIEASGITTALQALEAGNSHQVSLWKINPEYQNYPATNSPAHPTTFYMIASMASGSFNETIGSSSPEVNKTGPFIATISIPMNNLPPGEYSLTLKLYVNQTVYQDEWTATVKIG